MKTLILENPVKFGGCHSRKHEELREMAVRCTSGCYSETKISGKFGQQTIIDSTGDWTVVVKSGYSE